jgi:hypothetical protein
MDRHVDVCVRWEMSTKFWSVNLNGWDHSEDLHVDGEDNIRIYRMEIEKLWTGCIWLRIWTSGKLVWIRQWTFWFHRRRGISWESEWLLAVLHGVRSVQRSKSSCFLSLSHSLEVIGEQLFAHWHANCVYLFSQRGCSKWCCFNLLGL